MPLLLIGTGLVLLLTGVKGNGSALWDQLGQDFTGPNNFIYWLLSIIVLGALGYIKGLGNLSRLFIVLVLIALLVVENRQTGKAAGVTFIHGFQGFIDSFQGTAKPGGTGNG